MANGLQEMLQKRIVLLALAIGSVSLASALWLAHVRKQSSHPGKPGQERAQGDRRQQQIDQLDERWRKALQAGGERERDAAALVARAAALREEIFANEPLTLASSLNDLAVDVLSDCLVPADVQEQAEQLLRRALALWTGSQPEVRLARAGALESLSVLSQLQGDWQGAEQHARQALALYEQIHGKEAPGILDGVLTLAGALIDQGHYSEAARQYDRALRILGRPGPGNYRLHAEIQNELGELHRLRNNYGHAEEALGKAREYGLKVLPEEDLFFAMVSNNLAGLYMDRGEYSLAEPRYRRSLALREEACREDLATAELNLAEVYRLQGDSKRAEPLYDAALKHAVEGLGENHPLMAYYYNQQAVFYAEQERYGDAAEYHDVALQLTRAALGDRHPLVAQSLHDLAKLHDANGRQAEAQRLYREALSIREQFLGPEHPEVGVTLTWLASSLARSDQRKTAFETVERALRIFARTEAFPGEEAKAFEIRALLHREGGDRRAALADLGRSLEIVEDLRPRIGGGEQARAGFLARYADSFHRMIEWEVEEERLDRAFEYAERLRARVLVDQLLAARLDLLDSIPNPARRKNLSERQAAAQARLAEVQKQISVLQTATASQRSALPDLSSLLAERDRAEREVREVEDEIRSESLLWKRSGRAEPISLSSAQSRLVPRDGLILLYEIGPHRSFVIVIPEWGQEATVQPLAIAARTAAELGIPSGPLTREKLDHVLLGTGDRAGLLQMLGENPARRPGGPESGGKALAQGLHGLWKVLVPAPVWQQVTAKPRSQVLVVPDGLLHRLPLEALITRRGAKGIEDSSFWLDEGPPLRYSASATALAALLDRSMSDSRDRPGGPSILSVSDPVFAGMEGREPSPLRGEYERLGGSLTRLPSTAAETSALRELFGDSVLALQRGAAGEARVRSEMQGKRYLHLATHGVVAEGRELFAALMLTPPARGPVTASDDGFLQLFEIYPLELGCELAVLSACRTAFGAPREGEGVFTLSRGFQVAGARRVVASLWLVSDPASAALFKQFFHEVAGSDLRGLRPDYTKGLRDAKAQLVKSGAWRDPYFWAPFILTGEE